MSYQVLARKWRPKSFAELVGQEHVVTVLTNALQQQRLHHAYLFTGTRGVGKTTIARIFAKSLNCLQGITAEPCGTCDACVDIDNGRFVDLLEIDAASRTKVDDTREILDNVQYAPTRGRFKVYLIDEVHMLSRSSFNALLKTLEEPPEHVKFILATTDPKKLPITVLSRCLQFHLKSLTVEQISRQLEHILTQESVTNEPATLSLLAKAAQGSMRDSLSLTDQAIAQGQGHLTVANVQQMLGGVDQHWAYKILIALLKQDSKGLMALSLEIASYAPSYSRLLAEIIQLLHQTALAQIVGVKFDLLPEHKALMEKFVRLMSPEDVQLYYQIALNGRKDLPYAMDEQAAFDMVLLRMLAFRPEANSTTIVASGAVSDEVQQEIDELTLSESTQLPSEIANPKNNSNAELAQNDTSSAEKYTLEGGIAENPIETTATIENIAVDIPSEQESLTSEHHLNQPDNESANQSANQSNEALAELDSQMAALEAQAGDMMLDTPNLAATASNQNLPEVELAAELTEQASVEQTQVQHNAASLAPSNMLSEAHEEESSSTDQPESNSSNQSASMEPNVESISNEHQQVDQQAHTQIEPLPDSSPVAAVLASRNMLRSRKKALESDGKKSNDAAKRQNDEVQPLEIPVDVPSIETLPEQPYQPEIIDPAVVTKANQIDKWANMIDSMSLGGRLRQLAIHSTISENSTDDLLLLQLDQSTKHLQSDAAHKQLEAHLCQLLNREIKVEIEVVEATQDDPFQIQTDINEKRYDYAKDLLLNDDIVNRLQQEFDAVLDESTIAAR
ncbi:DNA polymerase III subunit gamma/tau [Thalassotalea fusca]